MTTEQRDRGRTLKESLSRSFGWLDVLKMGLSAALGYAIKNVVEGKASTGVVIFGFAFVTLTAVISLDRFRAASERDLTARLDATHAKLNGELAQHLDYVHALVRFVPDGSANNGSRGAAEPGYDAALAAVRKARQRLFVMGDYSPPSNEGAVLDKLPRHRSEYLEAIEDKLRARLDDRRTDLGRLQYSRYIQRPNDIYEAIRQRESHHAGVVLTAADMEGDLQAFEHCARVLEIAAEAERRKLGDRIEIQIRLIPFLPNCPSILLVDDSDVQFTIPTRIDRPTDNYAQQGLHGVLAMEDFARGSQIVKPFEALFQRLVIVSQPVIKIDDEPEPPAVVPQRRRRGPLARGPHQP
ncbi:hypothetical protein [Dactylosporangium sp. CS-033363]|uniref:hypothetical protein n=1 Tax=Dactylosporangium sp. CS-033363 TaxID=3239935 RepID=UPI003D8AF17B